MLTLKELMTRSSEPEVIESEIYKTLVEAVKAKLVGTELLALRLGPDACPGSSLDFDLHTKNSLVVSQLGEGQEYPIDNVAITTFNVRPLKYGVAPRLTKEMREDSKFDLFQFHLKEAGYQMARQLDSLIMAQIEAGSTNASFDVTGGAAITVANINTAMANLQANDYSPTHLVVHPNVAADIRNLDTFTEADKAGITNPSQGIMGTIFGMKVLQSSQVTTNYAYVVDKSQALLLVEKRPITIENWNDVTRDLSGLAVSARWGVRYLRNQANSVITTT